MKKLYGGSQNMRSALRSSIGFLGLLSIILGGAGDEPRVQKYYISAPKVVQHQELPLVFASGKYSIDQVRQGDGVVPRISVDSFPAQYSIRLTANQKKDAFLKTMLPMILQANERVLVERQRYLDTMSHNRPLTESDRVWLLSLSKRYGVDFRNSHGMLQRLDVVPASLALGQSAAESGWGLSGIAAKKKSPFGHRVKIREKSNAGGIRHRYTLRTFTSLHEAIEAYIHNINTHPAYANLRNLRYNLRSKGLKADGLQLAVGLTKYSELGLTYVKKVQKIIRQNNLTQFDGAILDSDNS
jgi:Bax protein